MKRRLFVLLITVYVVLTASLSLHQRGHEPRVVLVDDVGAATVVRPVGYAGVSAREWHGRFVGMRRLAYHRLLHERKLAGELERSPSVREALRLACVAYRTSCRRVTAIADCESTLRADAHNSRSTAKGLGQFLDSTWSGTPFGRFDVLSPYANALAIAYEVSQGKSMVHWQESASCWAPRS